MRVPLINLPFAVRSMSLCLGAFARLQAFLELPEFVEQRLITMPTLRQSDGGDNLKGNQDDVNWNGGIGLRSTRYPMKNEIEKDGFMRGYEAEKQEEVAIRLVDVNVQFVNESKSGSVVLEKTSSSSEGEIATESEFDGEVEGDESLCVLQPKRVKEKSPFSLRDINLELKKGQLVGVFGMNIF
jgi:hypothetical protein